MLPEGQNNPFTQNIGGKTINFNAFLTKNEKLERSSLDKNIKVLIKLNLPFTKNKEKISIHLIDKLAIETYKNYKRCKRETSNVSMFSEGLHNMVVTERSIIDIFFRYAGMSRIL